MKQSINLLILIVTLFFIAGCGNDNRQSPYMMGEKPADQKRVYTVPYKQKDSAVTIAAIEAETQKEIAKINKERDVELQKIEQNTKLAELKTQNEMAIKEHNLSTFVQESEYAYKNSTLLILAFAIIIFASLAFYTFRKYRKDKLKMHEEQMQNEMYLKEKEMQMHMAEKILDTIASGKLSEEREQHLLEALDKTTTPTLPHKK